MKHDNLPYGLSNVNSFPSVPLSLSVTGLKSRRPASDKAVTSSGLATKA